MTLFSKRDRSRPEERRSGPGLVRALLSGKPEPEPGVHVSELEAARRKIEKVEAKRREHKNELKRLREQNAEQERDLASLERALRRLLDDCGALPLPPPELREHVGRRPYPGNFLAHGMESSGRVLETFGTDPGGPVLDWGCGSGRTLTWLRRHPAWLAHYHGCDVDEAAIAWLTSQGVERVQVCTDLPPLPYADNSFVGLFCFSVLTHIPPERHAAWYAEMRRVLRPGGRAYVTVHSDQNMASGKSFSDAERAAYLEQGWSWSERDGHYKHAATVTKAFTLEAVGELLQVERYREGGYHQMDDLVLRKG